MSKTEASPPAYSLDVDERGGIVTVRARVSLPLFEEIMKAVGAHEHFRLDMPTVWDLRDSEGFGSASRAELSRYMAVSRDLRHASQGYRVAMVAGREVDFGVGRMMEGLVGRPESMEYAVFRDLDAAVTWAFGDSS